MAKHWRLARQSPTLRSGSTVRGAAILALIVFQSMEVSDSYTGLARTSIWVVPGWSIAALFALAGFTAIRSLERNGIALVAGRIATRFLPALAIVVVITAFLIGTIVTTEGWRAYLFSPDVPAYLENILGVPRYILPGVFEFNPSAQMVNPVMWVVPTGYIAVAVIALSAIRPKWATWVLGASATLLVIASVALFMIDAPLGDPEGLAGRLLAGEGLASLLCFVLGALIYRLRQYVPVDWRLAALGAIILALVAMAGDKSLLGNALFADAMAVPVAYLAVYICSLPLPLRHRLGRAEPLYWRVMLFAYPVQQSWIALGPDRQSGTVNLTLSLPAIVALATAQWLFVERPLLTRFLPAALRPVASRPLPPERRRRGLGYYADQLRAALPVIGIALLIILIVLAALALTVFAMQRDEVGA